MAYRIVCSKGWDIDKTVEVIHAVSISDIFRSSKDVDYRDLNLLQILVGNYAAADKLSCKCYKSYYIRAIAAARRGDAEGVKTNLEKACKSKAFAEKAAKDVEFAQYR